VNAPKRIGRRSSLREVAFTVCSALEDSGTTAVLTGGGAAAVWAPEAIQSLDLDFILVAANRERGPGILEKLGYQLENDRYVHPANPLFLEFPPGPLTIGGEIVTDFKTVREGNRVLHLLAPTDSCRDRLAGFLFWSDRGSLAQALAVARARGKEVDLQRIEAWCEAEGQADRFQEFARALGRGR
jgi:hypothetical protein